MLFESDDEREGFINRLGTRYNEEVDSILTKNFNEKKYVDYINRILDSIDEELNKVKDEELDSFSHIFKFSDANSINTITDIFDNISFSDKCNDLFKLLLLEYYEWNINDGDESESDSQLKELHKSKNRIFELKVDLFKNTLIYEAELRKLKEAVLNIRNDSKYNKGIKEYKDEFVDIDNLKEGIYSFRKYIEFTEEFFERLDYCFKYGKKTFINRMPIDVFPVFCYALLNNIEEIYEDKLGEYDFYKERSIVLKAPNRRENPDIYLDDYIRSMKIHLKRYCLIDKYINITESTTKKVNKTLSFFWFNSLTRYNDILALGKLGSEIIDYDISYISEKKAENKITTYANIFSDGFFSNKLLLENFGTKKLLESEKIGKTYRLLIDKLNKYIGLSIKDLNERIYKKGDINKIIIKELSNDDALSEVVSKIISQILIDIEAIEELPDNKKVHCGLFYAYKSIYNSKQDKF